MQRKATEVLPVSEIEHIFLLDPVATAIASFEGFAGVALSDRLKSVYDGLIDHISNPQNQMSAVARYCKRRIDRALKKIDLGKDEDPIVIAQVFANEISSIDLNAIASVAQNNLKTALVNRDINTLLRWYDNKALMSIACRLKNTGAAAFEQWLIRALRNGSAPAVQAAITSVLPAPAPA